MKGKTKQIAVGGIAAALTFVLCLLGSVSVGGRLVAPGICGLMLLLVDRYVSRGGAVAVFAVSAVLLFLLPERLSTFAYLLLLGYYPLLCSMLYPLHWIWRLLIKALVLTAVGCVALFTGAAVLGLWENPQFVRWFGLLIGVYYGLAAIYDMFIGLLRWRIQGKWDAKLRKLLG